MTILLWILLAVLAIDLLLPFVLAKCWPGYSHTHAVMSVLGSPASPVRRVYNIWLVLGGVLFGFGAGALCNKLQGSMRSGLVVALLVLLLCFALGAMVLSGLFSVGETKAMNTFDAKIHGFGASLGFIALLFVPLLLAVGAMGTWLAPVYSLCFLLAVVAFVLFVLADKPRFKGTWVDKEGLWQRLVLLFLYAALALCCWQGLH